MEIDEAKALDLFPDIIASYLEAHVEWAPVADSFNAKEAIVVEGEWPSHEMPKAIHCKLTYIWLHLILSSVSWC